jgi:hypothetical protein
VKRRRVWPAASTLGALGEHPPLDVLDVGEFFESFDV